MKLFIGGCRGTMPVSEASCLGYGGDTTSFLITGSGGEQLIVDAGTGLRRIGAQLIPSTRGSTTIRLLLSHYHLDHITGLTALPQFHDKRWTFEIAGPRLGTHVAADVIHALLDKPLWPLQVGDLKATVNFIELPAPGSTAWHGGLQYRWVGVPHPGGCVAYRIDEPATGQSVVIATDMEWPAANAQQQVDLRRLCTEPGPAKLLVIDGQYDAATYQQRIGWGHSRWEDGVQICKTFGLPRLLITHHDPSLDDVVLAQREANLQRQWPQADFVRSGMSVTP